MCAEIILRKIMIYFLKDDSFLSAKSKEKLGKALLNCSAQFVSVSDPYLGRPNLKKRKKTTSWD